MRKTKATHSLIGHLSNGLILALFMGGGITPAKAVLSDRAGQIQGLAPTATGSLLVLSPDGVTIVADNAVLDLQQRPNQFTLSSSTTGLVLQDADGDTGLSAQIDTHSATLTWKENGTALTSSQLAAPFGDNFVGKILTLEVRAPVTASSVTGVPTSSEAQLQSTTYTFTIPTKLTAFTGGLLVNGYTFAASEGFPKTGFIGATFTLAMDGSSTSSNALYNYSSDQAWVNVDNNGTVTFTGKPSSETKTVTIITARKDNSAVKTAYSFSISDWFSNNGSNLMDLSTASSWCSAQGQVLPKILELTNAKEPMESGVRGTLGSLYPEWGAISAYTTSGFSDDVHWTSEQFPTDLGHFGVMLGSGYLDVGFVDTPVYVVCRQSL